MVDIIQLIMAKEKKQRRHIAYNEKAFVAPTSINSMSAIHAKLYEDGTAVLRISDCHGSIKWHNNINFQPEVKEFLEKIDNAIAVMSRFRKEIAIKDKNYMQ
jgi:hypothetical protein